MHHWRSFRVSVFRRYARCPSVFDSRYQRRSRTTEPPSPSNHEEVGTVAKTNSRHRQNVAIALRIVPAYQCRGAHPIFLTSHADLRDESPSSSLKSALLEETSPCRRG